MTWRLIVETGAEAEISKAATWYRERGVFLQEAFLAAVAAFLASLENNSLQHQVVRGAVRRALIQHFPYALLYSISENTVVVTVCHHTSRDPKRWHARFPS